jgi:thioredoxin 1
MGIKPVEVTDSDFDSKVIKSEEPVLVDFWAPWCPPCRIVAPIIEDIGERMMGKLKVCKVNVDEGQAVAQTYGIRAIPTLMLFNKGQVVKRIVGALPKGEIEKEIETVLK